MRAAVAILAAVMSVTTGGPLRCPCYLVALLNGGTAVAAPPADCPLPTPTPCCPCKAHREADEPKSAEGSTPERTPHPSAPCNHGPGIDLVAPTASGERLAGESETGHGTLALSAERLDLSPSHADLVRTLLPDPPSSAHSPLRYCHSFRC